ncbi:MAG: hypothetical protein JSR77_18745 [Planctomycetes bacterium]|nr:hypothetical protein [Planctomycetota bacterium]
MSARAVSTMARAALVLVAAVLLGGCASRELSGGNERYTLVYLTTGPATPSAEDRKAIFAGHMANIQRLADERKLVIAGPFNKPANPAWRGIFVFDVATVVEADAIVATDPGIMSGVFSHESYTFKSVSDLRKVPKFERELNAAKGEAQRQDPAANIRGYVMVKAEDARRMQGALIDSHLSDKIIWWGRADSGRFAVFVIDSANADEVRAALSAPGIDSGPFVADGWWASKSLERLRSK